MVKFLTMGANQGRLTGVVSLLLCIQIFDNNSEY